MKKNYLIKNLENFQGKKYLNPTKHYFEGWYFKNTNKRRGISFIPGINIKDNERKAFIQVITNDSSYFIDYNIKEFEYSSAPFYIKIGNNFFSKNNIYIDINDNEQNLKIFGNLKYSDNLNIRTDFLNPNIMGPFSYIPFMECNHAILTMKSRVNGFIHINSKKIKFNNGIGYIEKDWGISFPKNYIWCQGNNFKKSNASFMISIANIPFKIFHFTGLICSLIIDNQEYRFATYNFTKIIKYDIKENSLNIILQKGDIHLHLESEFGDALKLIAPIKGEMKKEIFESISAIIKVTLKKNNKIIFQDTSANCGLEIVHN